MTYKYPSLRTTLPVLGYYARLDAGAAATDQFSVDGSQDGTMTNGATRADDGGLAYSLDGTNDYIDFPVTACGTSNTVACWVKSSDAGDAILIGGTVGYGLYFTSSASGGVLYHSVGGGAFIGVLHGGFSGWTHFAAVRNGTSVTFYKNGVSLGSGTLSANTALTLRYVGREGGGFYYAGLIDDVLIYTTNLDATNIGYLASQRGAIYAEIATTRRRSAQASIRSTF